MISDKNLKTLLEKQRVVLKTQIIKIHDLIIDTSGGEKGVRDDGGLDHAIYAISDVADKEKRPFFLAAKIYEMLATRHYFFDGNKRTSHIIAKTYLALFGRRHLIVHYKDAIEFIISIADKKKSISDIKNWIKSNSEKIPKSEDVVKHIESCVAEEIKEMREHN